MRGIPMWGVLAVVGTGCLATSGEPLEAYGSPKAALLALDLQRDFLEEDGKLPVAREQVEPLLGSVGALAQSAHAAGLPVVQVKNVFSAWDVIGNAFRKQSAIAGTEGAEVDPRVDVAPHASFDKEAPDAFSVSEFDVWMREQQVTHLVITGVYADGCVYWTARGALNRGYRVTVVKEAVAAGDEEARAEALRELALLGVAVVDDAASVSWEP